MVVPDFGAVARVLVVAPALPPAVGGAEVVADSVIRLLARHGIAVGVATGTPDADVAPVVLGSGGSLVHVGRHLGGDQIPWEHDTFARAEAVWRCCEEFRPDVVHVFSHDAAVAVAIAAPRAPVVGTFSEIATERPGFGRARSRAVYSSPTLTLVTASSTAYASIATRHGYPPERVLRLVTGVDLDGFAAGASATGRRLLGLHDVAEDVSVILCPSRFTERKGQLDLVAAMAEPSSSASVSVLAGSVNSGSSEYLERVEASIRDRRLQGRVRVLPGLTRTQMPDALAAADVVVQPSHREGLGLSALEAMAAGRPLVATQVAGFDEFLEDGVNALLVPSGDPVALAAALHETLTDEANTAARTRRARLDVEARFGWDTTATELARVYRSAVRAVVPSW